MIEDPPSRSRRSRRFLRFAGLGAAGIILVLVAAQAITRFKRSEELDLVPDEQKIARSLQIIRSSTPQHRKVLKVLFYGQSITASGWHVAVVNHWKRQYPNTIFEVRNEAIGGFDSQALEHTAQRDVDEFYPDLIIFHVYGDHRAYERIIRIFRTTTAADVILQTDHGEVLPDPPCAEGLHLGFHTPPGCAGVLWMHQRLWHDEMSYHKIPAIAKKYGVAIERQHEWWRTYLLQTHTQPATLLRDGLHPNDAGKALIAYFFDDYFDDLVRRWNGQNGSAVTSIPRTPTADAKPVESIHFSGNRLELLSTEPLRSLPAITIDGTAPTALDGCYQISRTTPTQAVPDWPAIRAVTLSGMRIAQDWTATILNISSDQRRFTFKVQGSVTGQDGEGSSDYDFVSKSGQLRINESDWMIRRAFELHPLPLSPPFEVQWAVHYVCGGAPDRLGDADHPVQYRYVLATGLVNQTHTAAIRWLAPPDDPGIEYRAYRPPLDAHGSGGE